MGGVGSLLAAVGLLLWIPLTTTIVGAITVYLGYTQIEGVLMRMNRAQVSLESRKLWWTALSVEEKIQPKNIDTLVRLPNQ
jgi:hypothetical protein